MPSTQIRRRTFIRLCVCRLFVACILATSITAAFADGELKFFDLSDFSLENGNAIRDCRLAYRTFGTLAPDKSNAIVFPTWLAGTTQDLVDLGFVGPGKVVDSSKYFVIAVDAFGNGVSSSPSNSRQQPGASSPHFSVRDMVNAQHALLSGHFGLTRVYAIVGVSMGAIQTFEWLVSYPQFMVRAIAVSGTPHLTSYDVLAWGNEIRILDAVSDVGGGKAAMRAMMPVHHVMSKTPQHFAARTRPDQLPQLITSLDASSTRYNADDWKSQLKSMLAHDAFKQFGGSEEKAAAVVRARTLVVVAKQDSIVYADPARSFAKRLGGELFELPGDCGHLAAFCETDKLRDIVREFLESKQPADGNKWKRQLLLR